MKQSSSLVQCWFLTLLICSEQATDAQLQQFKELSIDGHSFSNARVSSVTPLEVVVMWDGGGKSFKRTELPSPLKELYPYDESKAAAYRRGQEAEREKQLEQTKSQQKRANLELKSVLFGQRVSLKQRISVLEKELGQVHSQIDNRRPRLRRRLTAAEQADQERLTKRRSELGDQIDELNAKISSIDLRLAAIP